MEGHGGGGGGGHGGVRCGGMIRGRGRWGGGGWREQISANELQHAAGRERKEVEEAGRGGRQFEFGGCGCSCDGCVARLHKVKPRTIRQ